LGPQRPDLLYATSANDDSRSDVTAARQYLRDEQARWARRALAPPVEDATAKALQFATDLVADGRPEGDRLRFGPFTYPAAAEKFRQARTRAIIERVEPGSFEDPRFLALLARQAASIEIAIRDSPVGGPSAFDACSRVLLGTTGEPTSHGFSSLRSGHVVIAISAGMIDFMYQASKAASLALKRIDDKDSAYAASTKIEDTQLELDANRYPVDLLYGTLATWLYEGRPRAPIAATPTPEQSWPIGLLDNSAERFVLGHEYGHAMNDLLPRVMPQLTAATPIPNDAWSKEYLADAFSVVTSVTSASEIDALPANIALQGAVLAMKVHEIFDDARSVAAMGAVASISGQVTHPPFEQRIEMLEEGFLLLGANDTDGARAAMRGMLVPSETLDILWRRTLPRLIGDFASGRRLDALWIRS
jgi:hypothetical protein